ncbi:hypothetical protein [Nocardia sp. alder85J]|uniref:hypothetical protein n=1 Tax=Nocardia sp. alder85J TaxID=2862949 RepID=UPI001CD27F28|nr:hypothetical protein [Nocardia sp. alder85J]MCX4094929.1 hypothetical protein [Nocardia sp. alder85J]
MSGQAPEAAAEHNHVGAPPVPEGYSITETMKTLLGLSQLPASDAEIAGYAVAFEFQRMAVDALYAVPEARYASPALHFRAAGRIVDWADGS